MKKLQCEVCGSIEIKKISEDTFACQSCGIQYTKSQAQKLLVEIAGEVKIDHSQEIENALIRAKQFEDEGLSTKALEYYNKILDLAPHHETALHAITALKEKQSEQIRQIQARNDRNASAIKLIKHTVTPAEGLEYFLKSLRKDKSIAPDIYREMEVLSVQHGYYPFSFTEKSFSGSYDAVACYRKKIPYTDYETKTDYSNKNQDGSYKKIQIAVTKYREEIERQKVDGTFSLNLLGAYSLSGDLNRIFTAVAPEHYDAILEKDKSFDATLNLDIWPNYANDQALKRLEELITDNYQTLAMQITDVYLSDQKQVEELEISSTAPDPKWEHRILSAIDATIRKKARNKVDGIVPGDFSENVVYRWKETGSQEQCIFLPIQVVEYAYRGKFYICAMLLTEPGIFVHTFPCYTALKAKEINAQKDFSRIDKIPVPSLAIIMGSFTAAFVICGLKYAFDDPDIGLALMAIGCIFLIPAIISLLFWNRKRNRYKAQARENASVLNREQSTYESILKVGYDTFFLSYKGYESMDTVMEAVKKISAYQVDMQSIKDCTTGQIFSRSSGTKKQTVPTNNAWKDENQESLTEGCTYRIVLVSPGNQPSEIYKILRQVRNIGLATAKEMTETPNTIIAENLIASEARILVDQLTSAGASAQTEKE